MGTAPQSDQDRWAEKQRTAQEAVAAPYVVRVLGFDVPLTENMPTPEDAGIALSLLSDGSVRISASEGSFSHQEFLAWLDCARAFIQRGQL